MSRRVSSFVAELENSIKANSKTWSKNLFIFSSIFFILFIAYYHRYNLFALLKFVVIFRFVLLMLELALSKI